MKKLLGVLIILILVVAGGYLLYREGYKGNYSAKELISDYKCNINDVDYYVKDDVIYLTSKENKEFIYTDFGIYERKPTKDGWILTLKKGNYSIYGTIFKWIEEGSHPISGKIRCKKVKELPEGMKAFLDTHSDILLMRKHVKELE